MAIYPSYLLQNEVEIDSDTYCVFVDGGECCTDMLAKLKKMIYLIEY